MYNCVNLLLSCVFNWTWQSDSVEFTTSQRYIYALFIQLSLDSAAFYFRSFGGAGGRGWEEQNSLLFYNKLESSEIQIQRLILAIHKLGFWGIIDTSVKSSRNYWLLTCLQNIRLQAVP